MLGGFFVVVTYRGERERQHEKYGRQIPEKRANRRAYHFCAFTPNGRIRSKHFCAGSSCAATLTST